MTEPTFDEALTRAIGIELTNIRRARGQSRPELVKSLNCDVTVFRYGSYERGLRQPPISRLVEICNGLHVPAPELLTAALTRVDNSWQPRTLRDIIARLDTIREELNNLGMEGVYR